MTQQTAVEWLFMTLALTPMTEWYNVLEQAKVIEKEQIKNAYKDGKDISQYEDEEGEQYFLETYIK